MPLTQPKANFPRITALTVIVLTVGIGLRICAASIHVTPESDFQRYFAVASEFSATGALNYRGEPFIFQPPGYPALLGVVFKLFGTSIGVGVALNLVLSVASLFVMLKTLTRVQASPRMSLITLAIFSLYPGFFAFIPILGSETLSTLLVCATLLLSTYTDLLSSVLLGLLLAALSLTRPQYLPVVGALVLVALCQRRFAKAIILALTFSMALGPWIMRNQSAFGVPVIISANGGYVAFVNNNSSNSTATWMALSQIRLTPEQRDRFGSIGALQFFQQGDESEKTFFWTPAVDRVASAEAVKWIRDNPDQFLTLAIRRLSNTLINAGESILIWLAPNEPLKHRVIAKTMTATTILVTILAAVAAMLMLARLGDPTVIVAISIAGLTLAGIAVFEGQGRYLLPMLPALLICIALVTAPPDYPNRIKPET